MIEVGALIVLGGIVIFQQVLIGTLTSKIMARNFSEWVTGEKALKSVQKPREKTNADDFVDDYAAGQATKANQIFRI